MEQILKISRAVEQIGLQKVKTGVYRSSKYNYVVHEDGKYLIYNLFTRGMLCLTTDEYNTLLQNAVVQAPKDVDEFLSFLIGNYYLIPDDMDEQSVYCDLNDVIRLLDRKAEINSYTVLTTTACNARCFYCFEKDFLPVTMTTKTAHDLAAYMQRNCGGNKLSLHWFGGEPLCNTAVIDVITQDLKAAGCSYVSSITSNGYAFTEEIAKRAKEQWNVSYVQITLDGMTEEHNRRKKFRGNDPNPFEKIIENIHLLLRNDITVSVRINLDQNNIESVRELLFFLNNEFPADKKLVIYVAKIFDDCGAWKVDRTSVEREKLDESHKEFIRFLLENQRFRIKAVDNSYKYYHCGSNNIHHRTISPEGKFLACHNLSATLSYGSIYDGITDKETFDRWTSSSKTIREKCDGCALLPQCTTFSQCPNLKQNCKEDTANHLDRLISERYRRFVEKKAKE